MRYWRRGIWVGAVLATGAVVAVAVRERSLSGTGSLVSVLGFLVSMAGLVASTLRTAPGERSPAEHLEPAQPPLRLPVQPHRLGQRVGGVLQVVVEPGTNHVVMADPEGNEFCVQ